MKRRSLFGTHLYHQIVYPLVAASVLVGILATLVAVYFLEDLTNRWVSEAAGSSTENVASRYRESAEQMLREARMIASDEILCAGLANRDHADVRRKIQQHNEALGFDAVAVFGPAGEHVASVGQAYLLDGPSGGAPRRQSFDWGRSHAETLKVGGRSALAAFHPVSASNGGEVMGVARIIDERFLRSLGIADGSAYGFYNARRELLARIVGDGFDKVTSARISEALGTPALEVGEAMDGSTPYKAGRYSLRIGGVTYQLSAVQLHLPGSVASGSRVYVVGVRSRGLSEQAGRTTRNLIAMWSVVAVVALVGLGGWIARRVSDPLVDLAQGAQRIAEGDFSTKVRVEGSNELAELADTFNQMTDSLRERSESLTKKVLELATLYEMSRALGSTLDMDELLGSVLDSALRIFDLDMGYVVLRDKDTGALSVRTVRGGVAGEDSALRSSMSEWVVREGRPLIFNPDPDRGGGQIDSLTGARAALCVPLTSAEGTIGSITIGSGRPDYRFSSDDVRLLSTIANHVTIAIGNIELFSSLQEAYLATVRSLAAAVDAKDTYTRGHSDRVATYATMTAERMGLSHEQRIALEMAAYLHDIGKIGIREEILLKPGRLDDGEMAEMQHHPLIGANILKPVAFPWAITPVVRHHHEAYDGSGYPAGLKGEEIPLLARILSVADSFEAMTADRPYRPGRSYGEALEELRRCAGSQFDPRIVDVFEQVVRELESSPETMVSGHEDDILPEEARAIFAAMVDGIFSSVRRLGGPRLASNVEREVDDTFVSESMPFRIVRGRVVFSDTETGTRDEELARMRSALRLIDTVMGRVSGGTLVEHFYTEALDGLSSRMRLLAESLGFCGRA